MSYSKYWFIQNLTYVLLFFVMCCLMRRSKALSISREIPSLSLATRLAEVDALFASLSGY